MAEELRGMAKHEAKRKYAAEQMQAEYERKAAAGDHWAKAVLAMQKGDAETYWIERALRILESNYYNPNTHNVFNGEPVSWDTVLK